MSDMTPKPCVLSLLIPFTNVIQVTVTIKDIGNLFVVYQFSCIKYMMRVPEKNEQYKRERNDFLAASILLLSQVDHQVDVARELFSSVMILPGPMTFLVKGVQRRKCGKKVYRISVEASIAYRSTANIVSARSTTHAFKITYVLVTWNLNLDTLALAHLLDDLTNGGGCIEWRTTWEDLPMVED